MSATTVDRLTKIWGIPLGPRMDHPVKAAEKIPAGVMTARNSAGNAVNASDAAGLTFAGVSEQLADNENGGAGAITVGVHRNAIHLFANGGDIAIADVGKECYVADNQTVVEANPGHALKAGRIFHVVSAGVWVDTLGYCEGNAPTS